MTLDTRIYVHGETDVHELFEACRRAVLRWDDLGRTLDQIIWKDEPATTWNRTAREFGANPWVPTGARDLLNVVGQGLPAWLWLHYRPGEPYMSVERAAQCDEDCEDEDGHDDMWHPTPCYSEIMLDTTYGYRDERGWGCGSLHVALILEIGHYLDDQGIAWSWKNEFTGEIHDGFNNLDELHDGGERAQDWFLNDVIPAISARHPDVQWGG